jgi:hypothetical protein
MGQTPFSKPVLLRLSRTDQFEARSPVEALDYLRRHWPGSRTAHYRWAYALCEAASKGRAKGEDAYRALVDAAERAGLVVHKEPADGRSDLARRAASLDVSWPGASDIHVRPRSPALRSNSGKTAAVDSILASLSGRPVDAAAASEVRPSVVERGSHPLAAGDLK